MEYEKVEWFNEELDKFYGDNNNGLIFGVYWLDGEDVIEVTWFKTEQEREKEIKKYEKNV